MKEYLGKTSLKQLFQLIIEALPSKEVTADETTEMWNSVSNPTTEGTETDNQSTEENA